MLSSQPAGEIEQTPCAVVTVVYPSVTVTVADSVTPNTLAVMQTKRATHSYSSFPFP